MGLQISRRRVIPVIIIAVLAVISVGLFIQYYFETDSEDNEQLEKKIERINRPDEAYLKERYGQVDRLAANCDPVQERKAIEERLACLQKNPRAAKYWQDMQTAEQELRQMMKHLDIRGITSHLSCDAYDLTWYEMHCEADRRLVAEGHIRHLLKILDSPNSSILQEAVWQQRNPDSRLHPNPRWLLRSRLVNPDFKLIGPWKDNTHPTENGTLIMLEQELDGIIYIAGIPITGTIDE